MVSINLFGPIRRKLGREQVYSLSRCKTIREVLSVLLSELKDDPDFGCPESIDEIQRYFMILVDDSPIEPLMFDRELGDGQKVAILLLSHGG